jgi:hypothetical protein
LAVEDWSTTAGDNGTVGPVNIAEGWPAANANNAIREIMAQIKTWVDNLVNVFQPKTTRLDNISALAGIANHFLMFTGADTYAGKPITTFAQGLVAMSDAESIANALGAVRVVSVSLGNPGYIRFQIGPSSFFQIAWGTVTVGQDSLASVTYPNAFTSLAIPVPAAMGVSGNNSANENCGYVSGSGTVGGFSIYNSDNRTYTIPWIAVGV